MRSPTNRRSNGDGTAHTRGRLASVQLTTENSPESRCGFCQYSLDVARLRRRTRGVRAMSNSLWETVMTMLTALSQRLRSRLLQVAAMAALALPAALPAQAADGAAAPDQAQVPPTTDDDRTSAAQKLDAERLFGAIVKVSTRSIPDARSAETLGAEREGTGVVIGDNGLVLTIGYLIVEADDVKITDSKGRTLPARVVGYDHASGFGLVRTAVPLDAQPIPFGDSGKPEERDPVMLASAGGDGTSFAWIVSKRQFTGNWEYQLEYAIYTSPPTSNWSGAALIDRDGKLLGIGSLIVREATADDSKLPGNVFVPIDLLKPILADLIREGHRAGPARPWLGVSADEMQGRLFVTRVSPDGPADRAGVGVGDIILGVGTEPVRTQAQFYERVWNRRHAGDEVPLKVLQGVDVKEIKVRSIDRTEYFRPRSTI
jgi:S1-C subfamily serine protease